MKPHIWVIEAKLMYLPKGHKKAVWHPVLYINNKTSVYYSRASARRAAKEAQTTNQYNTVFYTTVIYRARKYVAE